MTQSTSLSLPGIRALSRIMLWVAQSWNGADNRHHAIDWYIQHPPEYLTSWYQHYHLTDISTPQEYWQSRVSKHIGMTFYDDPDVSASHVQANT